MGNLLIDCSLTIIFSRKFSCRLGLLWNEIRGDFKRFGFYVESRGLSQRQGGVFRVNCIDCLDRTNVVQCVLARHHLESLLNRVGLLGDSGSLSKDHPGVSLVPWPQNHIHPTS